MSIEGLRYDQFAFKASHNSIARETEKLDRRGSIEEQLSGTGRVIEPLAGLELDIHQASKDQYEWEVKHDAGAQGVPFTKTLNRIKKWCLANPKHPVLTIHLDLKNRPGSHEKFAVAIDELLEKTFGKTRIYRPADVIGTHADLVRGARAGGWASFAELRGKIVFCISGDAQRKKAYASHKPKKRACFADMKGSSVVPKKGDRVFVNLFLGNDTPLSQLTPWVSAAGIIVRGYNVVTRKTWLLSLEAGLNIISTDAITNKHFFLSGFGYAPLQNEIRGVPEHLDFARPRSGHRFKNWSKTVQFSPGRFIKPKSEAQIQEIVRQARRDGKTVRTQGAGHSFSQIMTTSDTLLSLDDLAKIRSWNGNQVTVDGGARLKHLIPFLKDQLNLGFANIGSVTEQSISGAFSTGTHGTGLGYKPMSSRVTGLTLVDGRGDLRTFDGSNQEELSAARMSMGMLGVITSVTLDCVPYYKLDYDAYLVDYDHVVDHLVTLAKENERTLLWWRLPILSLDKAILVTKNTPGQDKGMLADAEDISDVLKEKFKKLTMPRYGEELGNALSDVKPGSGFRRILHRHGGYEKMLTIPLLPWYHRELEYAVPIEHTATALRSLRDILAEGGTDLNLGCEVRFVRGDKDLLSATRNKDVCYIGVSTMDNALEVFERVEPMFKELDGRPHWGKHSNLTRLELKSMYKGGYDKFVGIRRKYDPDGVFLNSLLRRRFE